jgi:DNA-binding Lrp family transcriptional regulator
MLTDEELAIISHLRENSRKNLSKISRETRIPVSTIFDRLKKYEKSVIKKNTALLNFKELGYSVRVNLMLRVDEKGRQEFEKFLSRTENVNTAYSVGTEYDYMLECVFKNIEQWQEFMKKVMKFKVLDKKEFFIIKDLKKEAFMSNTNLWKVD